MPFNIYRVRAVAEGNDELPVKVTGGLATFKEAVLLANDLTDKHVEELSDDSQLLFYIIVDPSTYEQWVPDGGVNELVRRPRTLRAA
jgi:hypothetical protein